MHTRRHTCRRGAGASLGAAFAIGIAVLATGALGCATTPHPAPPAPAFTKSYRVGAPDRLQITIFPEPVLERVFPVRPDGKISIDLIGDVQAADRTPEEIGSEIEKRIARYKRDPRVTVAVAEARSNAITILGEVGNPNTFYVERETRVSQAIGLVGGPGILAARGRVRVIRFDGRETFVFPVDLGAIMKGDLRTNIVLANGDLVIVPPSRFAAFGHGMANILYPFQQLFGFSGRIATTVVTGGAGAAL
jgi:polysaccharide export outer membrane protein